MRKHVKWLRYLSFYTGIIVLLAAMLPVLTYENTTYYGYEIIFGKEVLNVNPFNLGTIARAWLPFSWLALTAFLLPVISSLCVLYRKKYAPVALLLSMIAIFLLFVIPQNVVLMYQIGSTQSSIDVNWHMGYGLVIAIASTFVCIAIHFYMFTAVNTLKLND
jgi:hypothetical protein